MPRYVPVDEAAILLRKADRVLVTGCSGGGKTTISTRISNALGLEFQSMDRDVFWLPGWRARDRAEQRAIIAALVARDRWVMDGGNPSSFDLRLPRADLVLWVRVPRLVALAGILRRVARNRGRVRPEMAPGCPERLPDLEFLSYIWNFEKTHAPRYVEWFDRSRPDLPVAVLRSRTQIDELTRRCGVA